MNVLPTKNKIIITVILLVVSLVLIAGSQCWAVFCEGCSYCYFFFVKVMITSANYELIRGVNNYIRIISAIIFILSVLYLFFSLGYFIYSKIKEK
ncbi:MAG: hypothetical protein KAT77_01000 [Nanoarchaeota archaeon]|nr:hypothetical protein [Nanoarchaeota archaeon]